MQENESIPEQASRVTAVKSSNWRSIVIAIVITALITGTGGYLFGIRTNKNTSQSAQRASFQPSPTTDDTTTVIIQDDYFFKVTIPHEYALIKGRGDYIRYVTDRSGEKIIGFYISSGLGESLRTGQTVIDGVPFTVEGEINTYNRGAISCSADLYATNAQFKLGHLYFGIYSGSHSITI